MAKKQKETQLKDTSVETDDVEVEENEQSKLINSLGGEEAIVSQVQTEYNTAYDFISPKITEWLVRMTVYNNQKRNKEAIGDPLLFTVFQTLLASLYDDRLNVEFGPREVGDEEVAENLNLTAEFDYDEMKKNVVDFEWDWDTAFFGNGLLLTQEFDRERMVLKPQVMDPCTVLRDPRAVGFNGDANGNNACRFWGREISATKYELEAGPYFDLDKLKTGKELKSLLSKAKSERRKAQGLSEVNDKEGELKDNAEYDIVEWYTHLKGKKYIVGVGNSKTKLVRLTEIKEDRWPAINRKLFPNSHDWDGVSIPDLVEDKQRARAILQNLG
jgi:hypothetical protein